jgi:uncharacterized alkaline shock family protein YloU
MVTAFFTPFFSSKNNTLEKKFPSMDFSDTIVLSWRILMYDQLKNMDTREIELPETVFIRDIDTRVFQAIALQCLAKVEGIGLLEGNLFDSLLGREVERVKGIHVVQDQKKHSIEVRVEINVLYGVNIPEKAEEVQEKLVEEMSKWTGLHVSSVHVIFKDLISPQTTSTDATTSSEFEEAF